MSDESPKVLTDKGAEIERRLEKYSMPVTETGCWLWFGTWDDAGYGTIGLGGRRGITARVHRVSWLLRRGKIPAGLMVCHSCDVRCCINPDHLFLSNHQGNMDDKVAKGRQARQIGSKNPNAKLSDEDVVKIRKSRASQRALAAQFGVSQRTIGFVKRREAWSHL